MAQKKTACFVETEVVVDMHKHHSNISTKKIRLFLSVRVFLSLHLCHLDHICEIGSITVSGVLLEHI